MSVERRLLSGAEIVLETIIEQDIDIIFGYPGGAVIPLYDALYDYTDRLFHVRTTHEQGAAHAADGYSRACGKVGVCFATSGPGATNTVTGIATAYSDSVPIVVITGQVPSSFLGIDSFQEADIVGITTPITKHSCLVTDIEDLPEILRNAFKVAKEGRPGPVLVDIPKDIFLKKTFFAQADPAGEAVENDVTVQDEQINLIADLINSASNPVICAGGGIISSDVSELLLEFVEKSDIPVVNTTMGKGSIPGNHPLSIGLFGMHGLREANWAVSNSDLIIALGTRFNDRVTGDKTNFASNSKVVHIDIDATELGKNRDVTIGLVSTVEAALDALLPKIDGKQRSKWVKEIIAQRGTLEDDDDTSFCPKNIITTLNGYFGGSTIVATDVGQHQMWTAQYWQFAEPRMFISSCGMGTMGYGLGAALGAKLAKPQNNVVLITGDGSFRMNCNELFTISSYNIPVTIVLFKNNSLGMVRQWQKLFQNKRYSETDIKEDVDYIKFAEACNIKAYRTSSIEELTGVLANDHIGNEPVFIECDICKNCDVYPIVPPGEPIHRMIEHTECI